MHRTVTASMGITLAARTRIAIQVAVADPADYGAEETVALTWNGEPVRYDEITAAHGGRVWLLDADSGHLRVDYRAVVTASPPAPTADAGDELLYLRPSRYCESDRMAGFAARHFRDVIRPHDILAAVSSWVGTQLEYVPGSSEPTDGAVETLLAAKGVCRDFGHLAVALLRAMEVPARLVAVYAPGLYPMDFHAVAEACIDGHWYVVDGTLLAPRQSLVRIATGRDAADISFLSSYGPPVVLDDLQVTATVSGDLPSDDVRALVQLQ